MPSKISRELALLVTGKDVSASKTLKGVSRQVSGLERHTGKAATNIGRNLERGVVLGAGAATVAIGFAVKSAMDWESAMAGVAKTVDGDVTDIGKGILDMSRKIPIAADELADLAATAGALGVAKGDILTFTEVAATLGVTTNVSADEAATALGQLGNVLGLTAADYEHFGSTLVDLGNKGASTEAQILEIARRAGGTGKMIDMATASTLGWSAAFANLGMQPELAGTAMQKFFQQSQRNTNGKAAADMGKVAGMTGKQWKKAFDKDASGALERFIQGLGQMPRDARLSTIDSLFGKTSGLSRALVGLSDSYDRNLAPSLDTASSAWDKNNAMAIEAQKRYDTTASKLQILQNNVKTAAITIGSKLLPVLAELSVDAVGWIDEHQADIEKFANDLRDGIRDAVTWAKKLDWDAIGTALQAGAGAVKAIGEAFLGLPAPLLSLLAGGFALNKLTGGVVVDIAADALKDQVFSRGASPANPLWVRQVGVPGVGGPGGAGAGAAAGLSTVGKVFLIGEAIGLALLVNEVRSGLETAATEQAAAVKAASDAQIAHNPSRAELTTALAGVEAGIRKLESDPIGTALIGGPALTELKGIRANIQKALADTNPTTGRDSTTQAETTKGNVFGPGGLGQSITDAQKVAADRVTTKIEGMRGDLFGALGGVKDETGAAATKIAAETTKAGGLTTAAGAKVAAATAVAGAIDAAATNNGATRIVGAINGIPAPITYVTVAITAQSVQRVETQQSRNGGGTTSRDRDTGGAFGGQ